MAATVTTAIQVDEETGEYMIDIPLEILAEAGIHPGDIIVWNIDENGEVYFKKKLEDPPVEQE
jgi:bifunctional DNA-binding transcriptional regulator/antitoxin component of YhaV-PrlF toxin-antitoxin module